jgi:ADP-ribose pyrophosphatase
MQSLISNSVEEKILSPWVTLVTRTIQTPHFHTPQIFHSLRQKDYVCVFALTEDQKIPIVKQYRPALDRYTLELPSGLLDPGEDPSQSAARELFEETGFEATSSLVPLSCLEPDNGRLENRLWAFSACPVRRRPGWKPEPQIECVLVNKNELLQLIQRQEFNHALNLAVLALAILRGNVSF